MNAKRRYTASELRASWTPEKRAADGPWTRYLLRPLAFPTAGFFLAIGWTPNAVTYLSILLCVIAFPLFVIATPPFAYTGFALIFLFGILDCADGTMARARGIPNIWGEWVDALGGYIAYTVTLLGIGAAAEASSPAPAPLPTGTWVLVGGIAAAANLLMRVVYQSFRAVSPDPGKKEVGGEKKLSETIGITGFLLPLSVVGYAFGALHWVVLAYAAVYGGGALLVIFKLVRKVEAGDQVPVDGL